MNIGENIKRLRTDKNITQEKLANYLQITYQTISKWERNEGYPDITMLIPLANYFEVTVDELIGADAAKNEIKIQEYFDEFDRLYNTGHFDKCFEPITKAYQEFPHDWRVINKYIFKLRDDGFEKNLDEIQRLLEDILERCNIDSIRYEAMFIISHVYLERGNLAKALEIIDKMPTIGETKANAKAWLFRRNGDDAKHVKYAREAVNEFTEQLTMLLINIIIYDHSLTVQEKIKGFEDIINVIKLVYGENQYCGFMNHNLGVLYFLLSDSYIINKEHEKGLECLHTALDYAIKYNAAAHEEKKLDGVFVKDTIFDLSHIQPGSKTNEVKYLLDNINEKLSAENSIYADIKTHPQFIALFEKYEPYARESK